MKIIMSAMLLAVMLTGTAQSIVSEDNSKIVYRQENGEEVTLKKYPKRTVIGYGSYAKVWDLAGGTAVGVPKLKEKDALPESMKKLPITGLPTVPNPEKIRPAVREKLEETLKKQTDQGYFVRRETDHRLSAKGRFYYAAVGSELLEAAASAWNGVQ